MRDIFRTQTFVSKKLEKKFICKEGGDKNVFHFLFFYSNRIVLPERNNNINVYVKMTKMHVKFCFGSNRNINLI